MTQKLRFAKLLAIPFFMQSQENLTDSKTWDVSNTGSELNHIVYNSNTSEGTWMNLDMSPHGEAKLFYVLGDSHYVTISGESLLFSQSHIRFNKKSFSAKDDTKKSNQLKTVLNS